MELSREDGSLAGEGLILHVEYFAHGDVPAHNQSPRITKQDCKEAESAMRRRLFDLGLVPGTAVTCTAVSPAGDPAAYLIRGAVIAIRGRDAAGVRLGGELWD